MRKRIECKSCEGTGIIAFPEVRNLGNERLPAMRSWCLGCGGYGYYVLPQGSKIVTYAGETKTEECPQ
jgi:DnaJ-class molecular chaperone